MDEKQLRAELDAVYSSTSWRVTAPLRYLSRALRQPRTILTHLKLMSVSLMRKAAQIPMLRELAKSLLRYFPAFRLRVTNLLQAPQAIQVHVAQEEPPVSEPQISEPLMSKDASVTLKRLQLLRKKA